MRLLEFPGRAFLGVLDDDVHRGEFVADAVTFGPVLVGAGFLAGGNQGFDLGDVHAVVRALLGVFFARLIELQSEDLVEVRNQGGLLAVVDIALEHRVHDAEGARHVEVVTDGVLEFVLERLGGIASDSGCLADEGVGLLVQALEAFLRAFQSFPSEVQVVAVVAADREEAVVERVETAVHQERNRQELAAGLAHLAELLFGRAVFQLFFASRAEEFAVHPETCERDAVRAFALRDFVRVVHADMVRTAAVNVERRAVILHGHGGAFDMPTRETNAPRAVPFHGALLVLRAELPQSEVRGVMLFAHVDATALAQVFYVESREVRIARELEAIEVDAVRRAVGEALFFQRLHQVNLFLNVLRSRRPARRFLDV